MSNSMKSEPISILKTSTSCGQNYPLTRIVMSDEEEENSNAKYLSDADNDEDEPAEFTSTHAVELLKTEKVLKAGYLMKKGEKRRTWKKRWFVLRSTKIAMYKDDKEYKILRIIDLNDIHKVAQVTSKQKYKFVFAFVTAKRTYYIQAASQEEMDDWLHQVTMAKENIHSHDQDQTDSSDSNEDAAPVQRSQPIDIVQKKRQDFSDYSLGQTYPLSFDDDDHPQAAIEGVMSSDDEDDVSCSGTDVAHVMSEESRNRVLIEGYLLKLGRNKGWRKRWFVLRTDTLTYYEDDKEYSPHKVIHLDKVIDALEIGRVSKTKQFCFKIVIPGRSYVLCSPSEEDMDAWLNALVVATKRAEKKNFPPTPESYPPKVAVGGEGKDRAASESLDHFGGAGGILGITLQRRNTGRAAHAK